MGEHSSCCGLYRVRLSEAFLASSWRFLLALQNPCAGRPQSQKPMITSDCNYVVIEAEAANFSLGGGNILYRPTHFPCTFSVSLIFVNIPYIVAYHVQAYDPENPGKGVDFCVCFGGDGTLLHLNSVFQDRAIPPLISFALGSLGFLTPFDFECVLVFAICKE